MALPTYVTVVWFGPLVALLTMGSGVIPNVFVGFWEHSSHIESRWPDIILEGT